MFAVELDGLAVGQGIKLTGKKKGNVNATTHTGVVVEVRQSEVGFTYVKTKYKHKRGGKYGKEWYQHNGAWWPLNTEVELFDDPYVNEQVRVELYG